jgi:hypothetical protein
MEPPLGADLGAVRIHTGPEAAAASAALDARAFTFGTDVFFTPGAYAPSTEAGRATLAHELVHVTRHGGASGALPVAPGAHVSQPHDREEVEAARGGRDLASGDSVAATQPPAASTPTLFRQPDDGSADGDSERVRMPAPVDLTARVYEGLRGAGMLTQKELDEKVDDLTDPWLKLIQAVERWADAQRAAHAAELEETRYVRLAKLRLTLEQKEYTDYNVEQYVTKYLTIHDLRILKDFGLSFPIRRSRYRAKLVDALKNFEKDWEEKHRGDPKLLEQWRDIDEFREIRDQDTALSRAAFDPDVLASIVGGIFGAIGYGLGGDEGAKAGAALDGILFSVGGAYEQRAGMPSSELTGRDPAAEVRPVEPAAPMPEPAAAAESQPASSGVAQTPPATTAEPTPVLQGDQPAAAAETSSTSSSPPEPAGKAAKDPVLDPKQMLSDKQRVEGAKSGLRTASRDKVDAEHRGAAAKGRVTAARQQLQDPPPSLVATRDRLEKVGDWDERLDFLRDIRESRSDWSDAEKEWLDQQEELLDAQLDVEGSEWGQKKNAELGKELRTAQAERERDLARSSKPLSALIRTRGPNFRQVSRVNYDQIMGEEAWAEFKAVRRGAALGLDTDHLVSVREIRDEVVRSGLLEIHKAASGPAKTEIENAIKGLGDERENLVRMERSTNQALKSDRSWSDIGYDEVASLYTVENVDAIKVRETKMREHYKSVIRDLVTRFGR